MKSNKAQKQEPTVRVLVLDDEAPIRRLVSAALGDGGCEVVTAGEGREGLQALLTRDFDVLVVDMKMKGMDGITFLQEALRIWPWMGVVIITGYVDDETIEKAGELGVTRILSKPLQLAELRTNVYEEADAKKQRVRLPATMTLDGIQQQLNLLRQISETAIAADSLGGALRNLSSGLAEMLSCAVVGVLAIEEGDEQNVLLTHMREPVSGEFLTEVEEMLRGRHDALSHDLLDVENLDIVREGVETDESGPSEPGSTFCVPVMGNNKLLGLLTLATVENQSFTTTEISFLYHAANHLSTVFTVLSRMRAMATHDSLTGLCNRRQLEEEMDRAWDMSQRYDHPMCAVIIDVDRFKFLNDTHGHQVGDQVLREAAQLLREVARQSDVISRYGGDEMVVILPKADREEVRRFCERLVEAVRAHTFCPDLRPLRITFSIGASDSHNGGHPKSPLEVLAQADEALYRAKNAGRDQFCIWADEAKSASETRHGEVPAVPQLLPANDSNYKGRMMLVDDDPFIRTVLTQILEDEGYEVTVESKVDSAIEALSAHKGAYDIVITDLEMPGKGGLDLLRELSEADHQIIKIVISGHATADNAIASLREGAYDFIEKPIVHDQLMAVISRALEYRRLLKENERYKTYLEEMVAEKSAALSSALDELRRAYRFTMEAMVAMLDAREHATAQHSIRVRELAVLLSQHIGVSKEDENAIFQGAMLHDIGKIAIPDAVLLKPGPLSDEEWVVMKKHPEIGYNLVKSTPFLEEAAEIVLSHHEDYNGRGYPRGLKGDEICLGARIFAIVDTYDALRSERVYRGALSVEESSVELEKQRGRRFDPALLDVFFEHQEEVERVGGWDQDGRAFDEGPTLLSKTG